ncbi:MAG: FliI/YscN family ATPase [candidate division Zixibacteria bacterium]|nr:FliI/YscN family ATPase [candidate division Zixibacteria bacterium]
MRPTPWAEYTSIIHSAETVRPTGRVVGLVGLTIEADGPHVQVGDLCLLEDISGRRRLPAEVVGFRQGRVLLMPIGERQGIGPGWVVTATGESLTIGVSDAMLGRVVDALGHPIDGGTAIPADVQRSLDASPPHPLHRPRVIDRLNTGVRVIDTLMTLGKGQRIGLFAGSGVGKSTLLGMISRTSSADVNVIALVGERGKEVRDFIERDLGPEGMKRSVTVVCTSDQPALMRLKAAHTATTIAEYFRDRGADVMLLVDSITRWALAQREVGLSIGEPPTTRGFPPSVFAMLPRLLERAGRASRGSITGVYSVLVEGDDMAEPISDSCRAILDGHISLSRRLASQNHFPAVDVLESISRVAKDVLTREECDLAGMARDILATYREAEDLISVGAYKRGSSPDIDRAIDVIKELTGFLRQQVDEFTDADATWNALRTILTKQTTDTKNSTAQ